VIEIKQKAEVKLDIANFQNILKKRQKSSMQHAAGSIRLTAQRSILKRGKRVRHGASPPGTPPYTTGPLRSSIYYSVSSDYQKAYIGPSASRIGLIGRVHEFGGPFRGRKYPKRPFMWPALQKTIPELAQFWAP